MSIEVSEKAGIRYLHFGSSWIQGAMRIARPWALELDYTREMMTCLLFQPEPNWPRRVLQIGLGAASLAKFIYRYRPDAQQTIIEINSQVVAVARQSFKLPIEAEDSKKLQILIGHGADFLVKSKSRFDLILVDGYDADARAGALDTLPFYLNCREHLSDDGLLAVNLLSRSRNFGQSVMRLQQAFDNRALAFPSLDTGNAVAFANGGEPIRLSIDELKSSALDLKKSTGLNLLPTLARLFQSHHCSGGEIVL